MFSKTIGGERKFFYASKEIPHTSAGKRKATTWMNAVLRELEDRIITGDNWALRGQQAFGKWLSEGWGLCPRGNSADPADLEIQRRYLDVLRNDLSGSEAPLLEQLLAGQIVLG